MWEGLCQIFDNRSSFFCFTQHSQTDAHNFAVAFNSTHALFTTTLPVSFTVTTNTIVLFFSRHMLVTNVCPGSTGFANRTRTDRNRATSLFAQCFNTARVAKPKVHNPCKIGSLRDGQYTSSKGLCVLVCCEKTTHRKSIHGRHVGINMQRIVIARQTIQRCLMLARHALINKVGQALWSVDRLGIALANILEDHCQRKKN
jgi:hypothetical protein